MIKKKEEGFWTRKNIMSLIIVFLMISSVLAIWQGTQSSSDTIEPYNDHDISFTDEGFFIESDYGDFKWEDHWLLKHIKHIYERRLIHGEIEKREKELWRDVYRIQSKLKQYLQLRTSVPVPAGQDQRAARHLSR